MADAELERASAAAAAAGRQAEQAEAAERERGRMHAELGQAATSAVTHGKHAAPSDEQSPIKARLTPSPTR